jgi:hypothetical protein
VTDSDRFALFARTRERLGKSFQHALSDGIEALADTADPAASAGSSRSSEPSPEWVQLAPTLRAQVQSRTRHGLSILNDLTFRLLELNQTQSRPDDSSLLSLLPGHGLDLQILADELANAIREMCGGDAYSAWLTRIDGLTHMPASETRAPFGASVLAAAVLESLQPHASDRALRCDVRIAMLELFAPRMAGVLIDTDRWLAHQLGQEVASNRAPDVAVPSSSGADRREAVVSPREVPSAQSPTPQRSAGLGDSLANSLDPAQSLGWSPLASTAADTVPSTRVFSLPRPHEFEHDAVRFAREQGVEPFSRQARQLYFAQPRQQMRQLGATAGQLAALDLAAALFDYLGDDSRLPAALRPLLWRLQQPVAVLATLDSGFLGDDARSVRRLVESVVSLALAHREDVARHGEVYRRLETSVRALEVIAHALQTRSTVLSDRVRHEYRRAEHGVAALLSQLSRERDMTDLAPDRRNRRNVARRPSLDTERAVTVQLESMLRQRLARSDVPESVQEFLRAVWLRHLRTALLRDGEESAAFKEALQVVDDLLWTLDVGSPGLTRRQLALRIPPLIRTLNQGVAAMGAKQEEYQPFLDALFLMHLRKMQKVPRDAGHDASQKGPPEPTDSPTLAWRPTQILSAPDEGPSQAQTASHATTTPRSRSESFETALAASVTADRFEVDVVAAPEEQLSTLLASIDLSDMPATPRRLRIEAHEAASSLRVGDWLEMEGRGGELQQVKVAWINPTRTVLLMVRREDRKVVSLRATELLQRFEQRKAVLIV